MAGKGIPELLNYKQKESFFISLSHWIFPVESSLLIYYLRITQFDVTVHSVFSNSLSYCSLAIFREVFFVSEGHRKPETYRANLCD